MVEDALMESEETDELFVTDIKEYMRVSAVCFSLFIVRIVTFSFSISSFLCFSEFLPLYLCLSLSVSVSLSLSLCLSVSLFSLYSSLVFLFLSLPERAKFTRCQSLTPPATKSYFGILK